MLTQKIKFIAIIVITTASIASADFKFQLQWNPEREIVPQSGRLFLFLSQRQGGQLINGPNWFHPEPFLRQDFSNWKPGETRTISLEVDTFPVPLAELPPGEYRVQALFDLDFSCQLSHLRSGNWASKVEMLNYQGTETPPFSITLDREIEGEYLPETLLRKVVEVPSDLLTDALQELTSMRAAIHLPEHYHQEPNKRYAVLFIIPGFGGSLSNTPLVEGPAQYDLIQVVLDASCPWGHHVFADSATNGPRGTALVEEFLPWIDQNFRTIGTPETRFLTGVSSGGWSSLWLQVEYPEAFGGVWSIAPDPVDFRDFQQINLYSEAPKNLFTTADGYRRPLAHTRRRPIIFFDDFSQMEEVLGRGGQLRSFEAVFSPLDGEGKPQKLWNRETGAIDLQVAESWRKYDISDKLKREWKEIGPQLKRKIHIVVGKQDTFYLTGAVRLLKQELAALGSDAEVDLVPGDHFSLWTAPRLQEMREAMDLKIWKATRNN
ncbi:Enterochelin esterase [Planctomycetales bacterium 10988]|nr:Enterochelin esterase [Planctomycetales bacterium 10988]